MLLNTFINIGPMAGSYLFGFLASVHFSSATTTLLQPFIQLTNVYITAEAFSSEIPYEDITQQVAAENQDMDEGQNLKDQIQHRLV